MKRGVCLMSGGVDSFVAAFLICQEWRATVYPLYLKRGASAQTYELQAVQYVIKWLQARFPRQVKPLKTVAAIFPPSELKKHYPKAVLERSGYVGREFYFAALATQYALTLGKPKIQFISTGSLSRDLYPHNGPEYWDQVNQLLVREIGRSAVPVIQPLQAGTSLAPADKKAVIRFAREQSLPIERTRSCVSSTKLSCGHCRECAQRLKAERGIPCVG